MTTPFTLFGPLEVADPEELRNRLHTLETLEARAPVPIAVAHDAECRVITANAALSRLLGVPPGVNISLSPEAGEEPPYRIQRGGQDMPADELPMQYAIAHRTRVSNDIEIVRADGAVMYVQNDVEPLYDLAGNIAGCVSVCVDLTERKRAEDLLRETDRRKDEFLATLSHELRNPLAPIRNALEVLQLGADDHTSSGSSPRLLRIRPLDGSRGVEYARASLTPEWNVQAGGDRMSVRCSVTRPSLSHLPGRSRRTSALT